MLPSCLSSSTPPLVTWRLPKADRSSICGRQRFSGDAAVAEQVDAWRVKEHHRRGGAAQSKHRWMRARRHRSPLVARAWRVFGITGEVVAPKEHLPPLQLPLPLRMYSMYGHTVVTIGLLFHWGMYWRIRRFWRLARLRWGKLIPAHRLLLLLTAAGTTHCPSAASSLFPLFFSVRPRPLAPFPTVAETRRRLRSSMVTLR